VSSLLGAGVAIGKPAGADAVSANEIPTFRTLRPPPEVPVETAVILLKTTQEAVMDWGGAFSKPGKYQVSFNQRRNEEFQAFKGRYQNYDLTGLYNQTLLESKDPRTNRLYFAFLNEVQWRTLGDGITRQSDQVRFSRVVGDRLYRKILSGDFVGPRTIGEGENAQVNMSSPFSGAWPSIAEPLPTGRSQGDLAEGARQLLEYLRARSYCKDFILSDFASDGAGGWKFTSFVLEPVNIDASRALVRSKITFLPRYDQRILQAYFGDRGFECDFVDEFADGIDGEKASRKVSVLKGIRTVWKLRPDPDAGL